MYIGVLLKKQAFVGQVKYNKLFNNKDEKKNPLSREKFSSNSEGNSTGQSLFWNSGLFKASKEITTSYLILEDQSIAVLLLS